MGEAPETGAGIPLQKGDRRRKGRQGGVARFRLARPEGRGSPGCNQGASWTKVKERKRKERKAKWLSFDFFYFSKSGFFKGL